MRNTPPEVVYGLPYTYPSGATHHFKYEYTSRSVHRMPESRGVVPGGGTKRKK